MAADKTFIILKPDCVQKRKVGEVLSRFEKSGFKIVGMKLIKITDEMASKHYEEHIGKPFYEKLLRYITSGPVIVAVLENTDAIALVRKMAGATDPANADPGTIRADYADELPANIIHASDSPESAAREISLYFDPAELLDYEIDFEKWQSTFD